MITELFLPRFDYGDINRGVSRTAGFPEQLWCAVGTRMVDSPLRKQVFLKQGPINLKKKTFSPIFDMRKADLITTLQRASVKLSRDYHDFGRSFDGIDYRYLRVIRDRYPEDYAIIKQWFPLISGELVRHSMNERTSAHGRLTHV